MEEYRIDMKVRNNLILSKIEDMGYASPYKFCEEVNLSYGRLLKFLNMKESIFDTTGKIKGFIYRLCDVLKVIPEEIFSANQMEASLKENKKTLKVNEAEVIYLMSQTDNQKLLEDNILDDQLGKSINSALSTLSDRERKVIEMRMGMGEYDREHTFYEVGDELGISAPRTRQIEAAALRKLRHPSRLNDIREYLEN